MITTLCFVFGVADPGPCFSTSPTVYANLSIYHVGPIDSPNVAYVVSRQGTQAPIPS